MNFESHHQPGPVPDSALQPDFSLAGHNLAPIQQTHGLHATGDTSTVIREAPYGGIQAADPWFHAQRPFGQSTVYDTISSGGGQSVSAFKDVSAPVMAAPAGLLSPMDPPTRPRKRKAPTLHEADWEPFKSLILDLHIAQNLSLPKVRSILEEKHGFRAELRQYRLRIGQWGANKNVQKHEMQAIVRKQQTRRLVETHKGQLAFELRGKPVESHKVERWMKDHNVVESALYLPHSAAPTPPGVSCYTISDRGSPAMISMSSPAAWVASPGIVYAMTATPPMPSPALSTVSSIVRPLESTFTGQSPALVHRPLAKPHFDFHHSSTVVDTQMELDVNPQPRYKQDEEERLRDKILQLEASPKSSAKERAGMLRQLAIVLINQGRYRAAEEVARRLMGSYESQGEMYEEEGMGKIDAMDVLANVLLYQGMDQKAKRLHQHVLRARERLLGHEHPDTLTSVSNLGDLLSRDGQYDQAEIMLRRVLEGREKVLGKENLYTLRSIGDLGWLLSLQKKHNEAEEMLRRALEGLEKVLGKEHIDTLISLHLLGEVLRAQGKYNEALVMFHRALEGRERVLGQEHPHTLTSLHCIGLTLGGQRKYDEAEVVLQRALEARKKVLGQEHPRTLAIAGNLATLYDSI